MIRKAFIILGLVLVAALNAQELEFVDLGVVEGEFKKIEREIEWLNRSDKSVRVKLISKNNALTINKKSINVKAGESATIPFTIVLPTEPGYLEYELQLVGKEEMLLHGFQFGLQVLAPEVDIFKAYRNTHWPFRSKARVFNLQAGYKGDTLTNSFELYNLGGADLDLSKVEVSDSVWVSFQPKLIKHNQFGVMTITMLASEKAPSGFQKTILSLSTNDKVLSNLPVQFTLLPPKKYKAEELVSGAPTITSSLINHDFKVMKVGEVETVELALANLGNEDLVIERLESNCDCLTFDLEDYRLKSGQSTQLKVTFNANGRIGLERKTIAVFSNDPSKPTLVLTFRAHVK